MIHDAIRSAQLIAFAGFVWAGILGAVAALGLVAIAAGTRHAYRTGTATYRRRYRRTP